MISPEQMQEGEARAEFITRYARLKAEHAAAIVALEAARKSKNRHAYGRAVHAYNEARKAWRSIRGWQ